MQNDERNGEIAKYRDGIKTIPNRNPNTNLTNSAPIFRTPRVVFLILPEP